MATGRKRSFDEAEVVLRATGLFWEVGYESAGMSEILERTGMARQSLYNTFGDKKRLFLRVLGEYGDSLVKEFEFSIKGGGPAYEGITDAVLGQVEKDRWGKGCLLVNTIADPISQDEDVAKSIADIVHKIEGLFAEGVERAIMEGDLPPGTPGWRAGMYLWNGCVGISVMQRAGRLRNEVRLVAEAVLEGSARIG